MSTISVFGSSWSKPGDHDYDQAKKLGELLASHGFDVMTGGYTGIMEAASWGASTKGGQVIGVTCAQIEVYRPLKANQWVNKEIKLTTLTDRLLHLITKSDGCVIFPGGIGTVSELSLTWTLVQLGEIRRIPIVCFGNFWPKIINDLGDYVTSDQRKMVKFVNTVDHVIDALKDTHKR